MADEKHYITLFILHKEWSGNVIFRLFYHHCLLNPTTKQALIILHDKFTVSCCSFCTLYTMRISGNTSRLG